MRNGATLFAAAMVLAACGPERVARSASQAPRLIPLASFVPAIESASLATGECQRVSLPEYSNLDVKAFAFLVPNAESVQRRVLVVVDGSGNPLRYSDVRTGSRSVHVNIDFARGWASAWNEGGGVERTVTRGSPELFFGASSLGDPSAITQQVLQRCGS